jgi:hypothetical protein
VVEEVTPEQVDHEDQEAIDFFFGELMEGIEL